MRRIIVCFCGVFLLSLMAWMEGAAASEPQALRLAELQRFAQQGNAEAQAYLGWMYDMGQAGPVDAASAAFWYQKAAEQGNVLAQYNLGVMYATGRGIQQHNAYAAYWFQKAADQGNPEAQKILGSLLALPAGSTDARANAQINVTALFLAGIDLPQNNHLEKFARTSFYRTYKTELTAAWDRFQRPNIDNMRDWWNKRMTQTYTGDIFYPFSGPDIFNVLAFFPDGDSYTLFGLEPVGSIPNLLYKTDAELSAGLNGLRKSINTIFGVNFFRTLDMEKDIKNTDYNGVAAILLTFIAKCNYTVIDAKNIAIDKHATVVDWEPSDAKIDCKNPPASQRIPGIEILFKRENGKKQVVRYFNVNVMDDNLIHKNPNFIHYIEKTSAYATMLKAASYLLHNDNAKYTKIRSTILEHSDFIVQDDSGIPLRYLKNTEWSVALHGVYSQPISLFANRKQNDLQKAYAKATGILPFSYGYNHKPGESNLLTAQKISQTPPGAAKTQARPEQDFREIENAALQGNADSQYHLGWLYYEGIYVQKNEATAARWYQQAAEQGHVEAQNWLGFMYAEGKGVPKNYIIAGQWYQKAAAQGHAGAKQNCEIINIYSN